MQEEITALQEEARILIRAAEDIVSARREAREFAGRMGFVSPDLTLIATVISELARNIVLYAGQGEIILAATQNGVKKGIAIVAKDEGPGIPDVELALQEGYSTSGGLGIGLAGVKRLMDGFEIVSGCGRGTSVKVEKWVL